MKQSILYSIVLVALSCSMAQAQYLQTQAQPQINVTGTAEVKVAPDEVCIRAGVETRDPQLDAAASQNNERVAKALAFLRAAGLDDKYVQTASIEVQPDYGPGDDRVEPRFYRVRKSIEVKLVTVTNLEMVLKGLLNTGCNNLYSVDFRTKELRKYRDEARAMAVKAAKEKASALCDEMEVKCGKPISINAQENGGFFNWSGNNWGWRGNNLFMNASQNIAQSGNAGSDAAGDALSVGQISVSATVNVTFLIQ